MSVVEEFLAQYPKSTQKTYEQTLREFSEVANPARATVKDLLEYQKRIQSQAPATVNRKLATLSSLYNYLQAREVRRDDPSKTLRRPTVDGQRSIRWLEREQIERILVAATDDPRLLAIVWAGLHSLRVAEISNLDVDDYSCGTLRVTGKGNKTRRIPLIEPAQHAFDNYIGSREHGPMFLSSGRRRISTRRIEYLIETLSKAIGYRISPHALRHTFGTTAIRSGNSTLAVQKVMGHKSPKTTEKYVHLDDADSRIAVDRTFGHLDVPLRVINGGKEMVS